MNRVAEERLGLVRARLRVDDDQEIPADPGAAELGAIGAIAYQLDGGIRADVYEFVDYPAAEAVARALPSVDGMLRQPVLNGAVLLVLSAPAGDRDTEWQLQRYASAFAGRE